MTREYCTYFDHRFASRGLAMIRSLRRRETDARVWVLCLSDTVYELLQEINEPGVRAIQMVDFEYNDAALTKARDDGRSTIEYYFTCTPSLVRYVMHTCPEAEWVTYLDSDLWFFDSPEAIYDEVSASSVVIIPHRYPPGSKPALIGNGIYNVGWVGFRRTADGTACLEWWRDRCIEWCRDFVDDANDRFGDQRYLNRFPTQFNSVAVVKNPGANLAPWNIAGHCVADENGRITVDGEALIFFHFHALKQFGSRLFLASHAEYGARMDAVTRERIYRPYLCELLRVSKEIGAHIKTPVCQSIRTADVEVSPWLRLLHRFRRQMMFCSWVLKGSGIWMSKKLG